MLPKFCNKVLRTHNFTHSGGTLSKSLNRGFATFLAGALGIGADYFASLFGNKGEPIVLGILVFLLGIPLYFSVQNLLLLFLNLFVQIKQGNYKLIHAS